jgi:hypothetical protein
LEESPGIPERMRSTELLKRRLRQFVIWSSRPPLFSVYRMMYRVVVRFAVLILGRYQGTVAIYLCRGCAKREITPGISDIDLTVITTNDANDKRSIQKACRILRVITGNLIDYFPNLVTTLEMEHRWSASPAWQYRYQEGRTTWKLLYGIDVLRALPELNEIQHKASCYAEMNHWWVRFADFLLKPGRYAEDVVMRNMICYKAVSELVNLQWSLRTGEYRYSRAAGLKVTDTDLARKLIRVAERRYQIADDLLIDEVYRFLLDFFQELWGDFWVDPFLHVHTGVSQEIDCPESELQVPEKIRWQARELRQHIETFWGDKCRGTNLVKSVFWDLEDFLFIIDVDKNLVPTVKELAELAVVQNRNQAGQSSRIFLFLRIGSVAFPLTPVIPRDLHRGLLTPATVPDVFLQLGESEVYWTDFTKWYLSDWRSNGQWLEKSALKELQLSIISGSVRTRRVIYPLTREAIERAVPEKEQRITGSDLGQSVSPRQEHAMFTVRETLLEPGDPGDRFYKCLVESRYFIGNRSIAEILDALFENGDNRCQVLGSVFDMLHVGFIFPGCCLTISEMVRAAKKAGFSSDHSTISSTVISRELGALEGRPSVPTDIFIARRDQIHGRSGYVEAFIPSGNPGLEKMWIEEEVGTHIGFTITDPLLFPSVQNAFEAEDFLIPEFMSGKPIANLHRGLKATYFEKIYGERKVRIEVLAFLGEKKK